MGKEEKKEEKKVISAVYKIALHCPQCARDIKKPILRIPGVHSVDVKFEKSEVTVKGTIDEKEIHKRIERITRRKVEIVPPPKPKEIIENKKVVVETKEKVVSKEVKVQTTTIKVFLHCNKCEYDLRTRLLKKKGVNNVKTDMKAQTITIEGTVESKKLLAYMKSVHKHAEIVPPKEEKKEEKKKEKVEVKISTETTKIVELTDVKKVGAGAETECGDVPYFVHYVYAPQMFSDENPNACSIM